MKDAFDVFMGMVIVAAIIYAVVTGQFDEDSQQIALYTVGLTEEDFGTDVTNLGPPSIEALTLTNRLVGIAGIKQDIDVYFADITDGWAGFATIVKKRRVIVYDREYFHRNKTISFHVLKTVGHEICHHTATHLVTTDRTKHEEELEADWCAGNMFARLNIPLAAAETVFDYKKAATEQHPASDVRNNSFLDGWHHGELMKTMEAPMCKAGWAGEQIDVYGTPCRMANLCEEGQSKQVLACENYLGEWVVQ